MKANVRIFKDSEFLSRAAAEMFVEIAGRAVQKRGRFLAVLSGGSSPSGLYRLLASEPFRGQVEWGKTFIFWGDERCVPPDDAGSNYHQAQDMVLAHVPIPNENILRIRGELEPAEAAKDYIRTLKEFANPPFHWPRFDLILLGMGEDGHTASLFPGSEIDPTLPVATASAHYHGRPSMRVTLTPLVINDAQNVMFLVTGKEKAEMLGKVLRELETPGRLPAQRIHPTDGKLTWLVDEAAASEL